MFWYVFYGVKLLEIKSFLILSLLQMPIKRTFQDIPSEDINKADQSSYLSTLARIRDTDWEDLLQSKRILIISEAGSGKTYECQEQQKAFWAQGKPAFFLELSELAKCKLPEMLVGEEEKRLKEWIDSQSDIATFFLDSIDELKISQGSFKQALVNLRKGIADQLGRARIVITTRPTTFDINLVHEILEIPPRRDVEASGEMFAQIAMRGSSQKQNGENKDQKSPEFRTVALLPLSDDQIMDFAHDQNIESLQALLDALQKNNAQEFARRPQDLIELCQDWRIEKRIRKHAEQVFTNIRIKLKPRDDRQERFALSMDKAIDGASRLALAMLVTRRFTIRHDPAKDTVGDDVALDPALILSDWNQEEIKVLLERPLFGFANYGRVRFHHRSVAEYLAAKRLLDLREKGMTVRTLRQLIFAKTKGKTIVRPSKRPVAGWLALEEHMIFELLRDHEPAALLSEGDPDSLTTIQRAEALRAYVERYGKGGWRGLEIPDIQIHRFASPELAPEINRLWSAGVENQEVRELLLDMVGMGRISKCSDLAYDSARNSASSNGERLAAFKALVQLDDPRLDFVVAEIADKASTLPDTIARGVLYLFFPKHITASQFCKILACIKVKSFDMLDRSLTRLIAEAELNDFALNDFRDRLFELNSEGLRWQSIRPHFVSDHSHACSALATVCIRGLKAAQTIDWLKPSVLALRLVDPNKHVDEVFKQLWQQLEALPAKYQELLFWAQDALLQSVNPTDDPSDRLFAIAFRDYSFPLDYDRDKDWIEHSLADTSRTLADRSLLLEAAISLNTRQEKKYDLIAELKPLVSDRSELLTMIDECCENLSKNDREFRRIEMEDEKRKQKQERKEQKAFASWLGLWREVTDDCDTAFSAENSENTAWNLWRVMNQAGNEQWNRRFIETQFDKETADRLRLVLMKQWRNDLPTLPSERPAESRGTTLVHWSQGLAGIYAEAEDPHWASKLSKEEAKLAARYALMELNGLPLWLEALIQAHPEAVDATLGEEVTWELNCPADVQWHSMLLQSIAYASDPIIQAFIPRLWAWFEANHKVICKDKNNGGEIRRLDMVVEILIKHGDDETLNQIKTIAQKILRKQMPFSLAAVWLPALMRLDASRGVDALENRIGHITPAQYSEGVSLFSKIFYESRNGLNFNDAEQFTPDLLLRLLKLSYQHVRPGDDVQHDGVFSPDSRDNAERIRNAVLTALLNAKGEHAWRAKLEVAADPLFENLKDRILAIAEERWAEEIDTDSFDDSQAKSLDTQCEAPPSTNEAMFNIMVSRLEDIDELLLSDESPRESWAKNDEERMMRRTIAHELKIQANGMYNVNQEAVTGDEKETDIRLISKISAHEAVIELKLANKYSVNELFNALHNQLVKKYLAPENRRSGCLLITLANDKKWKHPDNNSWLDFEALVQLLQTEAKRIVDGIGALHLHVHALDLRPRLPVEAKNVKKKS